MMDNILQVKNLCKSYKTFQLKNVTFSVPKGSIMGFVGENGAGKTTTIKLILNEIKRDGGGINIFGLDNIKDERKVKEQIGVVFDDCYFHKEFNAADIAKILSKIYTGWDQSQYESYLRKFNLAPDKKIDEYSKGMKMKLSIACALAHNPKLLILDEATSGLDPIMRSEILDIFLEFIQNEEHSVLFSSHITSDLEKVADYVTFIHDGSIIFSRSKDDLLYKFGVLKCGSNDFAKIDKADIIRYRKSTFEYEILVADKDKAKRAYPNFVIDNTTIDEIMLLYVKGEVL
jgi:ABC-2 type transport system ATP-binding protein